MPHREPARTRADVAALLRERLSTLSSFPMPGLDDLTIATDNVPPWWTQNDNLLLSANPGQALNLVTHPGLPPPTNSVVVMASRGAPPATITLWGDAPLVLIDAGTALPQGVLNCGGGSTIVFGRNLSCAGGANVNARNGGLISVGGDGLWSNGVYVATDDMHAILDVTTGERLNAFGGRIAIGEHVWIGLQAMLFGGATLGRDCVVGARSVVRQDVPAHSIVAGSPARVIRLGVTWSHQDTPPDHL